MRYGVMRNGPGCEPGILEWRQFYGFERRDCLMVGEMVQVARRDGHA